MIALSWSGVSSYGNDASSSRCHTVSGLKAWPGSERRAAYVLIRFSAISWIAAFARARVFCQLPEPSRWMLGLAPSPAA